MMLNGLQNSSKPLPLDISAAKLQPMDAGTTEPVSFGKILKLKEKQLQQEQEVNPSMVAAALASLQTPQLVAALSIQTMETGETVFEPEVSKASTDTISHPVTTSIERSDLLSLTQAPSLNVNVTEALPSKFPEVFNSVDENSSQQAVVKLESDGTLSPISFVKPSTTAIITSPTTDLPVQFTAQDLTVKAPKIAPAIGQDLTSVPPLRSETISTSGAIKTTETAADHHDYTASTTAKVSPRTFNTGTTTKNDVPGEAIKISISTAPQTIKNSEVSTQTFLANSILSEDKASEGSFSSNDPASKTVVIPNEEGGTKSNDFLLSDETKSNNREAVLIPNPIFQVQPHTDAGKAPSSSSEAIGVDSEESDLQTLDIHVVSRSTNDQSTETGQTSEFGNELGFVQPEIKENIHFYQAVQKDNNTASRPLPVNTTEDVPTRNTPTETDKSTTQQFDITRGQQSKPSAPKILATSSFSPNEDESEKVEKQIASQAEDEIKAGALHFDSDVNEIVSIPEIEPVDSPIGESAIKKKIAVVTNVDPGSVELATTNSKVDISNNLNSHNEVEMSSTSNYIQGQEFSVRLDQPGSQDVKTQVEQRSFGKVGTTETTSGQTIQLPAIPANDDAPLADDQAGSNRISASESTAEKLSDTQSKIDLKNRSQGSVGRFEVTADPEKGRPGTLNTYKSNTTTQTVNTGNKDTRSEAGETTFSPDMPIPSPIRDSSNLSSTLVEGASPISQYAGESQEMEVSKTRVVEKMDINVSEQPLAETVYVQTQGQLDLDNTFKIRNDKPAIVSIKPVRDPNIDDPETISVETATTLGIEPEIDANQQVIISQPEQDLSHVETRKSEKIITLAPGTDERETNISTESSEILEKNAANKSSDGVVPTGATFSEGEAGISLQTSSVADALENVSNSGIVRNVRSFQSKAGNIETKSDQRQIKVEIPISEHVIEEPSTLPTADFEISTGAIPTEQNFENKIQDAETNLSNLGAAAKFETLAMPDMNKATVMMDLQGIENITSQARYVESNKTADLTGPVLSNTYTAEGNKNVVTEVLPGQENSVSSDMSSETSQVAEKQSNMVFTQADFNVIEKIDFANIESPSSVPENRAPMPQEVMRTSANDDLSKSSTDENTSEQPTQVTKISETVPQVVGELLSQSEVNKAVEAKNGETQIHVQLPIDQSVQNGTIQFHKSKSKSDVEVKPVDFKSPAMESDNKTNTHTSLKNDAQPVTHQAPGVVEIVIDPIAPAPSKAHPVDVLGATQKVKQTEDDEKTLPVEKQSRLNQTPGFAAPSNGPVRETTATYPGGNVPSNQLHGDVKEVVDHVIRHINSNLKNGPTSMRLQLSPRELGAIDVQMVSDSQGVHVTFFAEQSSTGKLLETQLDQLRASLVDSGVHLLGLDIGQHNQSGQKGGSFEQSPNFTRDFSRNFPEAKTVSQEKPGLEGRLGRSTDIDYRI